MNLSTCRHFSSWPYCFDLFLINSTIRLAFQGWLGTVSASTKRDKAFEMLSIVSKSYVFQIWWAKCLTAVHSYSSLSLDAQIASIIVTVNNLQAIALVIYAWQVVLDQWSQQRPSWNDDVLRVLERLEHVDGQVLFKSRVPCDIMWRLGLVWAFGIVAKPTCWHSSHLLCSE